MKKVPLPEWCVSVKKAMVERDDMTVTELAKKSGIPAHTSVRSSTDDGAVREPQVRD